MQKTLAVSGFWFLVLGVLPAGVAAQSNSKTLPAAADALIVHGIDAADPTGQNLTLECGTAASQRKPEQKWLGYNRILVKFDLKDIPKDAKITSAKLRLRRAFQKEVGEGNEDQKITVSVYRLMKDWTEGRPDGVTWVWARKKAEKWTTPGADATPRTDEKSPDRAAEATASVNALDTSTGVANFWDVTKDVQAFLDGSAPNYGWILIGPEIEAGEDWVRYRSREGSEKESNPDFMPSLVVTW